MRVFKPIRKPFQRLWYDVPVSYTVLVPVKRYDAEADAIEEAFEVSEVRETLCRVLSRTDLSDIKPEVESKMRLVYSKKNKGMDPLAEIVSIGGATMTQFNPARKPTFVKNGFVA